MGKTSVISRFMYDKFDLSYQATIGIDFLSKTMYLDDRTVRLQLWDTAGQERFRSLIPSYVRYVLYFPNTNTVYSPWSPGRVHYGRNIYLQLLQLRTSQVHCLPIVATCTLKTDPSLFGIRDSSVAVIVYDVTSRSSFQNVMKWIEEVRVERGGDVVIAVVGNKSDLVDRREVSVAEGEALGVSEKTIFVETSAKAGFNVKALFRKIACALPGSDEVDSKKRKQRKQENELVELTLTAAPVQSASGCAC